MTKPINPVDIAAALAPSSALLQSRDRKGAVRSSTTSESGDESLDRTALLQSRDRKGAAGTPTTFERAVRTPSTLPTALHQTL